MRLGKRSGRLAVAVLAVAALATGTLGSGGPPPMPDYVTAYAQDSADLAALSNGRLGILKGAAPSSVLYLDWRLLNGLTVGATAGKALATPCCDSPSDGVYTWLTARRRVPTAAQDVYFVSTERSGPNYTTIPTCFNDAFVTASATLDDRIARFGASPAVGAWLAAQDAVFLACSKPGIALPAPLADAPAWLTADRAYQDAALALYDARFPDAARGFAAIARDKRSPWRAKALYLEGRTIQRAALTSRTPQDFARAHAAIARLAGAPEGTFGKTEIVKMRQVLDYNEYPRDLLNRLDRDLGQRAPTPDIAVAFRDYLSLSDAAAVKPDAADWIRTIQAKDRAVGLDHARTRWAASGKSAWLVAALSLAMPDDPAAAGLARDAARVAPTDPAWLTAQYHLIRLAIARTDPAITRAHTDAILARGDLTRSDRNIFTAIRAQLATDLPDFARHALRDPYCTATDRTCIGFVWPAGDGLLGKRGSGAFVGIGGDARAVIDRLPLRERMALGDDAAIPRDLRLDLALTNYARAVQLQDARAIDTLAMMLADLLPQVKDDWRKVAATPAGPAKRFAEFFVMAKIPSLRTDLADYARPSGPEPTFQGYWVDWMLLPRAAAAPTRAFAAAGRYTPHYWDNGEGEPDQDDLTCLSQCGAGNFPLHLPAFAAALLPRTRAERGFFMTGAEPKDMPPGATSLWEEAFLYARAHPQDPRAAETLYRLIRVARWGGGHDHLGKRAFHLLHARYPASSWTEKSPYYYD